jgi:hypothetical protein
VESRERLVEVREAGARPVLGLCWDCVMVGDRFHGSITRRHTASVQATAGSRGGQQHRIVERDWL